MKELSIQRKIIEHFEDIGAAVCKLQAVSRRGWPDIIIVFRGEVLFVETKTTEGRLSKVQKAVHAELIGCGGRVYTVTSIDELIRKLNTGE